MIVITLSKVPMSLRGDLTKWCQEVQTGVYVGNFSARIRDLLWERITKSIGNGEATLIYSTNNELGYTFRTTRKDKQVINFDGLPFIKHLKNSPGSVEHGFSKAAKLHRAKKIQESKLPKANSTSTRQSITELVAIDLETTGLKPTNSEIISISAVKRTNEQQVEKFNRYIKIESEVPATIQKLTGLSNDFLNSEGESLEKVLEYFQVFIGNNVLVGYNLLFDQSFLNAAFIKANKQIISNRMIDLMPIIKKDQKFLDNYRLATVLKNYGIENDHPHKSISDAMATLDLALKLIKNDKLRI
ncbi:type I-E CRISPR-associated endoribonuclease Cas2e [Limosilactobacillus fermentum]|uniref:DNA polymerase III polC-type n=1 Tax=Limosilactobacillus fermentum NB-22 TaxID=1408443 RepID=A0A829LUM0_LIMFE|nr:type I-E CRISPR-associated endoribonuclease Cas2e [Limosilactobacillus fermentum]ESS00437.1 3'-5' exonuclease [Limosilactobacillus fermentum NB-22]KLD54303.1 3'-5' exonuclease [Limosilactobacillus fermentum]MBE8117921.1 type I-E CRISPR-associated endoribonuclease Cas2 [Limosilactobacillus fermentum]MCH5396545.1 type I-E CRISPR-associated endoribonuclease Cas2e [Limosilactobacillus fermentum]MCQ2008300.1 type I-E CRISPR-associated endoribonuclease Cas2e [Limosilactobacillus fermentum]